MYYKHPEEGHIITLRADGTGRQDVLSDRVSAPGARGGGTLSFLTWSPDERMIVFNCYAGLCAVHTDGRAIGCSTRRARVVTWRTGSRADRSASRRGRRR